MADLLWLSAETPDVNGGGGQRRQFHQIAALLNAGAEVTVASLAGDQDDSSIRTLVPVHRFGSSRRYRPCRDLRRLIGTLAPSRALIAHVESASHVVGELQRARIPYLIDFHNVVSRWHASQQCDRAAELWRKRERDALAKAETATACSAEERAALLALGTDTAVELAPHGVDPLEWPASALSSSRELTLAMFGSWYHEPNRTAAEWLVEEVWSEVRAAVPESKLLLLGPGSPPKFAIDQAGVEYRGRVASLAETLGRVRVAVVPIQSGIGTRVKFVESLASGSAVVSTTAGQEGFAANGGFLRADTPDAFSRACIELLKDEQSAVGLGAKGREVAFSRYSWAEVTEPIIRFAHGGRAGA